MAGQFGTRLVVVLGHSMCGAVTATLGELERPTGSRSPNLRSIVDRIRPSVEGLLATDLREHPDALLHQAIRANIRASANHLRNGSQILEQLIQRMACSWWVPRIRSKQGSSTSSMDYRKRGNRVSECRAFSLETAVHHEEHEETRRKTKKWSGSADMKTKRDVTTQTLVGY